MSKTPITAWLATISMVLVVVVWGESAEATPFTIIDTGQILCYDTTAAISCPAPGDPFHGQDAQYDGDQPSFTLSVDGLTIHDNVNGLTWVASPDTDGDGILESPDDKLSWWDALDHPATLNAESFGGFADWRLPSIKELYSLIDFSGIDPSGYEGDIAGLVPFIDTDYFAFEYGNEDAGERIIDSQYWSSTEYVSTTMNDDHTVFGVNFADGRIKGYGTSLHGDDKVSFVLCCRGNIEYGMNEFTDNGDGTVTDTATGLMWQKNDSGYGMTWEEALAYAESLELADQDDWRLPNVKELQSILDYTRSPDTHGTAAIDPVLSCTAITDEGGGANFPFYWSGTTHANWTAIPGAAGAYVCFGEALGWMQSPHPPFDYTLLDVHGAGAQRSDPKEGDPDDWPHGHGPQGDVIRIFNFVRCVRNVAAASDVGDEIPDVRTGLRLDAAPNPFNPATKLVFSLPDAGPVELAIHDMKGRRLRTLVLASLPGGEHTVVWDGRAQNGRALPSGTYFARLVNSSGIKVVKMLISK